MDGDETDEVEEDSDSVDDPDPVSEAVWGVAVSLIGFAQSMLFSAPSSSAARKNEKNLKIEKYKDDHDSDTDEKKYVSKKKGWGWGKKSPASALSRDQDDAVYQQNPHPTHSSSFGQMMAPPTDSELSSKGLGFTFSSLPPPPQIAEDLMKATPRAGQRRKDSMNSCLRPPDDVSIAVAIARHNSPRGRGGQGFSPNNSPNSNNTNNNHSIPSSLSLDVKNMSSPSDSENKSDGQSFSSISGPNSPFLSPSLSPIPPRGNSTSANGYSMGSAMPQGVKWRYVDVLSNRGTAIDQEQMK